MALLAKCCPYRCGDLSSWPRAQVKNPGKVEYTHHFTLGQHGGISGVCRPISLACSTAPRQGDTLSQKAKGDGA